MILQARIVLASSSVIHDGGGVVVRGGRIERVLTNPRAVARAARAGERVEDMGDGVLAPGFVNAHAHLELGELAGRVDGSDGFSNWIRSILSARRSMRRGAYARGVATGVRRAIETGTTSIGDIASTAESSHASRRGIRSVVYREVLDAWDSARTAAAMNFVRRALPKRRLTGEGIAPHAPYTTSSDLLDRVRSLTRQRPMPITVHWSETESEIDWLSRGAGELAHVLGASPRCGGLDLLDRAGLLGKHTSLAHGNHPRRGEPERIAAKGATLVHCPGTHAFFGRAAFPWRRYARAGVRIALGTDSLASNSNLDMRREMALVRAGNLSLSAREVFSMATEGGARALGLGGRVGVLARGAEADLVLHRLPADLASEPLEALTSGEGSVGAVWLAGRRVFGKR